MAGIFLLIITIGAIKHWGSVSVPVSTFLGCVVAVYVFGILLLPSLNGPRDIAVAADEVMDESSLKTAARQKGQYQTIGSAMDADFKTDVNCGDIHDEMGSDGGGVEMRVHVVRSSMHGELRRSDNEPLQDPDESHDEDQDIEVSLFDFPGGVDSRDSDSSPSLAEDAAPSLFVSFYGRHVPLSETVCMWRTYGLAVIFMCVAGAGILVINNVQAIAQAVKQQPSAFFVTVLSIANASGRMLVGIVADIYVNQISRLQVISAVCVLMAATQLLLSFGLPEALYPSLLVVGVMFGAIFSSMAAAAADIFGAKYVGSNYGYIDLAPALGSYIFSAGTVALFYPSPHDKRGLHTNMECVGAHCFRYAFWVTCCCCLLCAGLASYMHILTPIDRTCKQPVALK
jgi:hypothetical protein